MAPSSIIHLRNAIYFGPTKLCRRNGRGLLILDNSQILFAEFKDDIFVGDFIFIGEETRAYGTMNQGRLQGFCIIVSTPKRGGYKEDSQLTGQQIFGNFRKGKLYGKMMVADNRNMSIVHTNNSQIKDILQQKQSNDLINSLVELFPENMYTLEQHLTQFIKIAQLEMETHDENAGNIHQRSKYCPVSYQYEDGVKFYGFEQTHCPQRKHGFMLKGNEMMSVGEHRESEGNNKQRLLLQGIGRLYVGEGIYDGVFRGGQFHGIGATFMNDTNRFIVAQFMKGRENGVLEQGFGFPHRQISEMRREFHLRSIHFYNDIVLLGLSKELQSVVGGLNKQLSKQKRLSVPQSQTQSRVSRSPFQRRLERYSIQDQAEIERRNNSRHFEQQYRPLSRQRRQQQGELNTRSETPSKIIKREQESSRVNQSKRGGNREYRQSEVGSRSVEREIEEGREEFQLEGSRSKQSSLKSKKQLRDTRELLNELKEEERKKKLDLDRIYRESGLLRKQ